MELRRWVLPSPGGPQMNRGLYASPGISAAAPDALPAPGAYVGGGLDHERLLAQPAGRERFQPLVPSRLGDGSLHFGTDEAPAGWVLVVDHGRVRSPPP